jgi:hypothetical protein
MDMSIAQSIKQAMNAPQQRRRELAREQKSNRVEKVRGMSIEAAKGPIESSRGRGVWTQLIRYNPEKEEMIIKFSDGFIAAYPNISERTLQSAIQGNRTKSYNPNRNGSLGAWLHQHPEVMKHYHEGSSEDLMGAQVLLEDNTYQTTTFYEGDGQDLFYMTGAE